MTNINTFQDILQAMEQDPALRDAIRHYILTEELLQLPVRVYRLEVDVAEIKVDVAEIKVDVAALKEGQARLESSQARLESSQARLEERQERLESNQARMSGQLGNLIGSDYERQAARLVRRRLRQQLGIGQAEILQAVTVPDRTDVPDLLDRAAETGAVSHEEADDLELADLVLRGQGPGEDTVHVVAEVSQTVRDEDIRRAARRAEVLGRATGGATRPAVIGESISDGERELAERERVVFIQLSGRQA